MSVKLFNQGKRTIRGEAVDPHDPVNKDGSPKKKPFVFPPKEALEFSDEEARKLKKMFGSEMLSMEDVKSQFSESRPAAEAPSSTSKPATDSVAHDPLSSLSEDERVAVLALRAAKPPEEAPVPKAPVAKQEPSAFVNVTEEEGKAALAAIEAVRAKNAAANPDAPENQPATLMQKVRDALGVNKEGV